MFSRVCSIVRQLPAGAGLLGPLALASLAFASFDQPEAADILRRVAASVHTLKFEGEQVVEMRGPRGGRTSHRERVFQHGNLLRVEHVKERGNTGQQDKPGRPDHGPVTIIKNGMRQVYHPQQKTVFQYPLKRGSDTPPRGYPKNVRPQVVGEEEIAGRPTWQIELRRPDGTVARRLWIDKEKYLPIKRESLAPDGSVAESRAFTSINFQPTFGLEKFELPADLQVRTVALQTKSMDELKRETASSGFRVVSSGDLENRYNFKFEGGDVTKDESAKIEEVWLRFSNPRGRLSIFQRRDRGMAVPDNLNREGQLALRRNGWLLTLVGTFRPSELQQFADALNPDPADK